MNVNGIARRPGSFLPTGILLLALGGCMTEITGIGGLGEGDSNAHPTTSAVSGTGGAGTSTTTTVSGAGGANHSSSHSVGSATTAVAVATSAGSGTSGAVTSTTTAVSSSASSSASTTTSTATGAGGADTSSSTGSGSTSCDNPPMPVGQLSFCGGSAAATTGGPTYCAWNLCDQSGNKWEAECNATGCSCSYNSIPFCYCVFEAPDAGCDDVAGNGCCPAPWPDPSNGFPPP